MDDTYYSAEQVAEALGMHVKTIQRYIREGALPASRIGRLWRVSGRDLADFAERNRTGRPEEPEEPKVKASVVLDIRTDSRDEAIRIVNTLTAVLNGKPPEYGTSTLTAQFIEPERTVRVALWGELRFTQTMLEFVAGLTGESEEGKP
jgi:excisionase family DNA binding protein